MPVNAAIIDNAHEIKFHDFRIHQSIKMKYTNDVKLKIIAKIVIVFILSCPVIPFHVR